MDLDRLLGTRFDLHLADGQVLDIRISAVDPGRDLATAHVFVAGGRRERHQVVLTDVQKGIRQGVLVENGKV